VTKSNRRFLDFARNDRPLLLMTSAGLNQLSLRGC
jgi:hypothetical protein